MLLAAGFLWIVWDSFDGFVLYQHTHWIWQSQHLPAGETILRDDAVVALSTHRVFRMLTATAWWRIVDLLFRLANHLKYP